MGNLIKEKIDKQKATNTINKLQNEKENLEKISNNFNF